MQHATWRPTGSCAPVDRTCDDAHAPSWPDDDIQATAHNAKRARASPRHIEIRHRSCEVQHGMPTTYLQQRRHVHNTRQRVCWRFVSSAPAARNARLKTGGNNPEELQVLKYSGEADAQKATVCAGVASSCSMCT